jgi:hypothetical protein
MNRATSGVSSMIGKAPGGGSNSAACYSPRMLVYHSAAAFSLQTPDSSVPVLSLCLSMALPTTTITLAPSSRSGASNPNHQAPHNISGGLAGYGPPSHTFDQLEPHSLAGLLARPGGPKQSGRLDAYNLYYSL